MPPDYDFQNNLEKNKCENTKKSLDSENLVFLGKKVLWFLKVLYPFAHDSGDRSE